MCFGRTGHSFFLMIKACSIKYQFPSWLPDVLLIGAMDWQAWNGTLATFFLRYLSAKFEDTFRRSVHESYPSISPSLRLLLHRTLIPSVLGRRFPCLYMMFWNPFMICLHDNDPPAQETVRSSDRWQLIHSSSWLQPVHYGFRKCFLWDCPLHSKPAEIHEFLS